MENLAFLHSAVAYEDPGAEPELRSLDTLLPKPTQVGAALGAVTLSLMAIAPQAEAVVRRGDSCPAVRDVQTALTNQGYNPGTADGVFGPKTEAAVRQFQRDKRLTSDGEVGLSTASQLGLADPNDTSSVYAPGKRCTGGGGGGSTNSAKVAAGIGANVRSTPRLGNNIIGSKGFGTTVRLTNERVSADGYTWAKLANEPGWMATSTLSMGGGSGGGNNSGGGSGYNAVIRTNGSPLNVRSGPGVGFPVIDVVGNGSSVRIVEESGGWGRLSAGGWVSLSWVGSGGGGGGSGSGGGGAGSVVVSTNGGGINARFGPGTSFGIGATYADGAVLNTTGRVSGGWVELTNGLWVSGSWVL